MRKLTIDEKTQIANLIAEHLGGTVFGLKEVMSIPSIVAGHMALRRLLDTLEENGVLERAPTRRTGGRPADQWKFKEAT